MEISKQRSSQQPSTSMAAAYQIEDASQMGTKHAIHQAHAPAPLAARLAESLTDTPFNLEDDGGLSRSAQGTVLYLAYGSNLSNETFRGRRGIKPLSQINVQVPSLRLTFDLPGIAYTEPCFANSGPRDPENDPPRVEVQRGMNEKTPLLDQRKQLKDGYRKDNWHKGLIGVVYEVTPEDFAHILQSEGGGASYQDILVDCHPFASSDPSAPVPQTPTLPAFKAHTLFAPSSTSDDDKPSEGARFQRPDTSYAQPSARYLKLISDGAAELGLPYEYRDYLHSIRPYRITLGKQRVGQFVFMSLWIPVISFLFMTSKLFADKDGHLPTWVSDLFAAVFKAAWASYDIFFEPIFGDGERSIPDGGHDGGSDAKARRARKEWSTAQHSTASQPDPEKTGT